jgi:glutathione peroxidase
MNKLIILLLLIITVVALFAFMSKKGKPNSSIHQFKAKLLDGSVLDLSTLKGKKILIVNTASKCGFTPQYKELETLYETYKNKNLVILGFPCNQFGGQEPGTSHDIEQFCTKNFGVSFLMMEKTNVKGDSISEIYAWLTSKQKNGVMSSTVRWNFQKYMIDENGFLVDYVFSFKSPNCKKIISWLQR